MRFKTRKKLQILFAWSHHYITIVRSTYKGDWRHDIAQEQYEECQNQIKVINNELR